MGSNNGTEGSEHRHQPKQSRSVETFNSILEAAADLFEQRGYGQTTTHQIAAEAGVSVGALYRYFEDKQAVIKELYQRETSRLRQRVLEEINSAELVGQDIPVLVQSTLALAFSIYSERPGLRRVLSEQARKIPELVELRRSQEEQMHQTVRQILGVAPGVRLPDLEVGAYLVCLFMESLIDDYLLYRQGASKFDQERIVAAAADFIMRYVLGRNAATEAT
jgi:AcrR family transcriptional regulator